MTPTDAQIAAIGKIADEYRENCKEYEEFKDKCSINVLFNDNSLTDNNITVVTTTIYKLNQDNRPLTMTTNITVEPNGKVTDMDDYLTKDEQADYLSKLTKLEMNK